MSKEIKYVYVLLEASGYEIGSTVKVSGATFDEAILKKVAGYISA